MTNAVFDRVCTRINAEHDGGYTHLRATYRLEDDYSSERRPEMASWRIELTAVRYSDEDGHEDEEILTPVGSALIHVIDIDPFEWNQALEAMDEYSQEMLRLYEATSAAWDQANRIYAVDHVRIETEYRGNGLGPMLLVEALVRLGAHRTDGVAVLEAGTYGWEDMHDLEIKTATKKTIEAWKCAGFTKLPRTKPGGDFMILRSEDISIPETEERLLHHLTTKQRE